MWWSGEEECTTGRPDPLRFRISTKERKDDLEPISLLPLSIILHIAVELIPLKCIPDPVSSTQNPPMASHLPLSNNSFTMAFTTWPAQLSSLTPSLAILLRAHPAPATLASLLYPNVIKLVPTSGPLYLLFPMPGKLFSWWHAPSSLLVST